MLYCLKFSKNFFLSFEICVIVPVGRFVAIGDILWCAKEITITIITIIMITIILADVVRIKNDSIVVVKEIIGSKSDVKNAIGKR